MKAEKRMEERSGVGKLFLIVLECSNTMYNKEIVVKMRHAERRGRVKDR